MDAIVAENWKKPHFPHSIAKGVILFSPPGICNRSRLWLHHSRPHSMYWYISPDITYIIGIMIVGLVVIKMNQSISPGRSSLFSGNAIVD